MLKIVWFGNGTINDLQEELIVEGHFGVERLGERDPSNLDVYSINILFDRSIENDLQGEKARGSVQ